MSRALRQLDSGEQLIHISLSLFPWGSQDGGDLCDLADRA